jgi:ketosteroid isomerase-like protein
MSEENVERFHRLSRSIYEEHRIAPEHLTEDVEWVNPDDAVEPGSRHGPDGFNDAIRSIFEGWDVSRFEPDKVFGKGDDLIALGRLRTQGRSGVELSRPHAQIWTFRDGRLSRMRWFQTHEEALAAAGHPPSDR